MAVSKLLHIEMWYLAFFAAQDKLEHLNSPWISWLTMGTFDHDQGVLTCGNTAAQDKPGHLHSTWIPWLTMGTFDQGVLTCGNNKKKRKKPSAIWKGVSTARICNSGF